ncbi:MAG: esterase [Anaerolineae bacterium]|nr:esterase [Anaerolineae bacterium]NUQ05840.1 esterase [Anaerolineae bacterium]
MVQLFTTLGPRSADELGMILPHEHIFVDLRTPDAPGFAQADVQDVIALMVPEVERAKAAGVTALVECTPIGVGRRADMVKAVSEATHFPIVMATGIYREPWVPSWAQQADEAALYDWMLGELTNQIEDTGVRAAWIKLSAGDDGLTAVETKILRAAARAAKATGAVIGSHTRRGRVVKDQLAVIESVGCTPERFIWIHTQAEPDFDLHLEMAARGVWIEYDWIGNQQAVADAAYMDYIQRLLDAGHGKILLSHDRGWFDPGNRARVPQPFTYLSETFIPRLRAAGIDAATVHRLTHTNPFAAFAR